MCMEGSQNLHRSFPGRTTRRAPFSMSRSRCIVFPLHRWKPWWEADARFDHDVTSRFDEWLTRPIVIQITLACVVSLARHVSTCAEDVAISLSDVARWGISRSPQRMSRDRTSMSRPPFRISRDGLGYIATSSEDVARSNEHVATSVSDVGRWFGVYRDLPGGCREIERACRDIRFGSREMVRASRDLLGGSRETP